MARTHVRIGVIGVGEAEQDYGFQNLQAQARLQVAGVWNPSWVATQRAASQLRTVAVRSIDALLRRGDVEGIVVLNSGWTGWHAMHFASLHKKPALVLSSRMADRLYFHSETVFRLIEEASAANVLLMPGLLLRWLPATIRLRELTATSLGAVEAITVEGTTVSLNSRYLADLLDWCCNVVQSAPVAVRAVQTDEVHGLSKLSVEVTFRRRRADGGPVRAMILLSLGLSAAQEAPHLVAVAECRHGRCRINGDRDLEWTQDHLPRPEHLANDRSEIDVALDLFGRRVVGGVVPVPDLSDVGRSLKLVAHVIQSLREQREIVAE
jgi:hypothetical protein